MTYKIDKNVSIPKRGNWKHLADEMKDGDSILVESGGKRMNLATSINKIRGFKAITRKEGGQYRVWKTAEGKQ